MSYQPNIKDPRVIASLRKAYTYAIAHFDYEKESMHSMQAISKRFGQAQKDKSKWLMKTLLICTDHHYSEAAGISKKYILNKEGVELIQSMLGIVVTKQAAIEETYIEEYAEEFQTGNFTYKESSDRFFHPLQNIKSDNKKILFYKQGYNHDYDINCCAPTLLYQEALKCGLEPQPIIHHYIENRTEIRESLAVELQTTPKIVKGIITALFQGAKLGTNEYSSIYREYNDTALIRRIQQNEYITKMRESIVLMWKALPIADRRSGRLKNDLYRKLELQVLKAIVSFLKKTNNKHFTEHDGWKCEYEIDEYQLYRFVKEKTGYNISLSHICLRDICEINDPSLRAVSVTSSVPSLAYAHSDTDSLQLASPNKYVKELKSDSKEYILYYSAVLALPMYIPSPEDQLTCTKIAKID